MTPAREFQSTINRTFSNRSSRRKRLGPGLGLATVYGIIVQSGGHITLTTAPEEGTAFRIYLPAAEENDRTDPCSGSRSSDDFAGGTETILLVEDAEAVRRLTERILRKSGYTVLAAENGEDALRQYSQHSEPIDLLLTDVVMPGGMSGRELADQLRFIRPTMKLLFMSGYTDDEMVRHGVFAGRTPFLEKPFDSAGLLGKVREALDAD